MKPSYLNIDSELILGLKEKYFGDLTKQVELKKGEFLMKQNYLNKRLYMVLSGLVAGYIDKGEGGKEEIFRAEEPMIVGFHSFFSKSFKAYTDVIALKDSKLAYIEYDENNNIKNKEFTEDFVPVIVHELSARQLFAKKTMLEKEAALKQLYEREKLVTLGQMASGLAHELNNAIGVINGNSEWIAKEVFDIIKEHESNEVFTNYEKGFEKGHHLSTVEVRKQRKFLERKLKISQSVAKKLAKLEYDQNTIENLKSYDNVEPVVDRMHHFWEMGVAIHDILLASKHAVHVLKSIKQLSVSDQIRVKVDVNATIEEALTLLKKLIKQVDVEYNPGDLPDIIASPGELVQIWINIVKNACESMIGSKTDKPQLTIKTREVKDYIEIIITNNGPEIPDELKEKIFQPNFTTKKDGLTFGLGLGLSVVQRLIETYNGTIEVKSNKSKTCFIIRFPHS